MQCWYMHRPWTWFDVVVLTFLAMRWQVQQTSEVQLDVAPKKVNWDLKQHIAKKLAKLERRTQQAIIEIIKEKVSHEGDAEESGRLLAAGVSNRTA